MCQPLPLTALQIQKTKLQMNQREEKLKNKRIFSVSFVKDAGYIAGTAIDTLPAKLNLQTQKMPISYR